MIALESYFDRIGHPLPESPSLKNLRLLHRAHVMHIPFENLDIHYPQKIVLDTNRFYDKIVLRQRGGFCYEQNGLLLDILRQLGYHAHFISVSVYQADDEKYGPPAAHVAITVELEGQRWLVDVGFGSSFPEPLLLCPDLHQEQDGVVYLIRKSNDNSFELNRSFDGARSFSPMYRFDLTAYKLAYFTDMCHFHQTSEESTLYGKKLISIAQTGGRITLTNKHLIVTKDGERKETPIKDVAEFQQKLKEYFGFIIVDGLVQNELET